MEASIQSQQELTERYETQVSELQELVQTQEQKLAEVPHYLERMRQAKEVCTGFQHSQACASIS